MKKNVLIIAFAVLGISFTSCKKDHVCTCIKTFDGVEDVNEADKYTINDKTRSAAKKTCEDDNITRDVFAPDENGNQQLVSVVKTTCSLKK